MVEDCRVTVTREVSVKRAAYIERDIFLTSKEVLVCVIESGDVAFADSDIHRDRTKLVLDSHPIEREVCILSVSSCHSLLLCDVVAEANHKFE